METWKSVVGFEGLYEVSDQGRIRALFPGNHGQYKPGRVLEATPGPKGYSYIGLYRPVRPTFGRSTVHHAKMKTLHSIVLEAFRGPRPKGQVCRHLDGIRTHNQVTNLTWGTSKQNAEDAKKHGTFVIGSKNGFAILTESDIVSIRKMRAKGFIYRIIGKIFRTHWSNILLICHRKTWAHVT